MSMGKAFEILIRSLNRKWFFFCVSILLGHNGWSQVFFNSTHTPIWHQQVEQPALMGQSEGIRTIAAYRYQWVGIEGAPMTVYAGADMKLPLKNISGGVFFSHDRAGASAYTSANISLAYSIPVKKNFLSIGARLGMMNMMLDGSRLISPSDNLGTEDPILSDSKESAIRPDIGIGISYVHSIFHIGAFVNNIADFKTRLNGVSADFNTDFGRYLGVGGAARIPVSNKITLDPSFLLRMNMIHYQLDVSLAATIQDKYTFGIGSRGYTKRSFESLMLITKIKILPKVSVMYSFDLTLNRIQAVSHGSHEVSFLYVIPKNYKSNSTKIINHPRYL